MPNERVVIIGAGGHAASVAETVLAAGYKIAAFVSDSGTLDTLLERPVVLEVPTAHLEQGGGIVVAIGDNYSRFRVITSLLSQDSSMFLPTIVHPSANVSGFATLGRGTMVMQGAIVGSRARIGLGCIVNSGAIIEHDCELGDFASVAPGGAIGGQVKVGFRSAVSIGAVVKHGVSIGDDSVIGAASYVHSDVAKGVVAFGAPARVMRERRPDDPYLN